MCSGASEWCCVHLFDILSCLAGTATLISCVPHRVIWGLLAFALCCIVDFGPCLLVCPGSSVGRALCLDCRVSWVRVPPRAALFSLKKSVILGAVELFALHLCYLSPHYDSCIIYHTAGWRWRNSVTLI